MHIFQTPKDLELHFDVANMLMNFENGFAANVSAIDGYKLF